MSNIRRHTRRVALGVAGAAVVAGGLTAAFAGPVSAAPATRAAAAHTEYFTVATAQHSGKDSEQQTFVAHGAFAGGGRDDASHDNYDVLHFGNGTLQLRHPQKESKSNFHVNPKTCYVTLTLSGPYTLANGTGQYKGVKGHGTYHGTGQYIAKRTAAGKCELNQSPRAGIFVVHGSGPVSMP